MTAKIRGRKGVRRDAREVSCFQRFAFVAGVIFNRLNVKFDSNVPRGFAFKNAIKRKHTILGMLLSAFFVLNIFLLSSIVGQISYTTSLQSHGGIRTMGVTAYADSNCNQRVYDVDWGIISPGVSSLKTFYLKNEGNADVLLSLQTTNWNPSSARNYMGLTWDYTGQSMSPGQVVAVTLSLSVAQSISGIESFNFDIEIIGTS